VRYNDDDDIIGTEDLMTYAAVMMFDQIFIEIIRSIIKRLTDINIIVSYHSVTLNKQDTNMSRVQTDWIDG